MIVNNRSFGLDIVRAIAIILVIIAHFAKTQEYFGFWGVELFFALSGYLIGQILWKSFSQNGAWDFYKIHNFWSRRWWRTLPNYYLFFFVSLVFSWYSYGQLPPLSRMYYFLWFGQDLFTRNREFYGVSWSLCIEEWFYLLFPIILLFFDRIKLKKDAAFILTILTFIVGCFIIRAYYVANGEGDSIRTITCCRVDAIACGVLASYLFVTQKIKIKNSALFLITGVLLFLSPVIANMLLGEELMDLRQNQFLLLTVPLGAALTLPTISGLLYSSTSKWIEIAVEKISLWSYSIYLSHIPVLFLFYYLMKDMRGNVLVNLLSKVIGLVVTVTISALIFKYFEVPLTAKRPKDVNKA